MLRKLLIVAALCCMPSMAMAEDIMETLSKSTLEFTLSGSGFNDKDFENFNGSVTGGVGAFLTHELEVSLRQTLGYNDPYISGTTLVAVDYNWDLKKWWPYVGANFGYQYGGGNTLSDAWVGGPEAGIRYFVNKSTFIYAQVQYEFEVCHGFDTGSFFYTLGIGFWN